MDRLGLNIKSDHFEELSQNFVLDLIALFSIMHEDVESLLDEAVKEEWTPERLIKEIEDKI